MNAKPLTLTLLSQFASSHGRIARGPWLRRLILAGIACIALGLLLQAVFGDNGAALASLLFVWCAGCLTVKRLHDSGRTGWNLLFLLIPVLGPLWVLRLALLRGSEGSNPHGRDPLAAPDYLNVDIAK
jgi:uncharacterized membrane protein YhaH (DUF805 family)